MSHKKLEREFPVYSDGDIAIVQEWRLYKEIITLTPPFKELVPGLLEYRAKDGRDVFKEAGSNGYLIGNKIYYEKDGEH